MLVESLKTVTQKSDACLGIAFGRKMRKLKLLLKDVCNGRSLLDRLALTLMITPNERPQCENCPRLLQILAARSVC